VTTEPDLTIRAGALTGSLAGLILSVLHEVGIWSVGPDGTLWPIGAIVFVAALGLVPCLLIGSGGSWGLGIMLMVPNVAVLFVYGLLLVFFGLGGSR